MAKIDKQFRVQALAKGRVRLTSKVTLTCPHERCGTKVDDSAIVDVQASIVEEQKKNGYVHAMMGAVPLLLEHERRYHKNVPSRVRQTKEYKQYVP